MIKVPSNKKYLLVDTTNLLYRAFYAHRKVETEYIAGLAHHVGLTTLNKYYKLYKPDKIVLCFDRHSWRKEYTTSEKCISKLKYKGNRRQQMTPSQKLKFEQFIEHIGEFEQMIRDYSSIICLAHDGCEGDDLIAGFVQMFSEDNEIVIISGDKDLIQLLDYPNTSLVDPATGKQRTLEEWNGDAKFFMYEKSIRGDRGDNVRSAFPGVRKTRILKAYNDPFEHLKLMEETWKLKQDSTEYKVKDLFNENQLLMNLNKQPEDIQKNMIIEILKQTNNPGKFSYFHFIKFLSQHKLDKIKKQAELFVPMLNC